MNCETCEDLLADALGDELAQADRPAFDAHLASCAGCRAEYEGSRAAVEALRGLPGPQRVCVERQGSRLVLHDGAAAVASVIGPGRPRSAFRFAAAILLAFIGGYAFHAGRMWVATDGGAGPPVAAVEERQEIPRDAKASFQSALVRAHLRNQKQPALAKCMVAMFSRGGGR